LSGHSEGRGRSFAPADKAKARNRPVWLDLVGIGEPENRAEAVVGAGTVEAVFMGLTKKLQLLTAAKL
jgi:hypothetical protein